MGHVITGDSEENEEEISISVLTDNLGNKRAEIESAAEYASKTLRPEQNYRALVGALPSVDVNESYTNLLNEIEDISYERELLNRSEVQERFSRNPKVELSYDGETLWVEHNWTIEK